MRTIEELKAVLMHPSAPAPMRNWPHSEDCYPLAKYHRQPIKRECKDACDQRYCLTRLCVTRLVQAATFSPDRPVTLPVAMADRQFSMNLKLR